MDNFFNLIKKFLESGNWIIVMLGVISALITILEIFRRRRKTNFEFEIDTSLKQNFELVDGKFIRIKTTSILSGSEDGLLREITKKATNLLDENNRTLWNKLKFNDRIIKAYNITQELCKGFALYDSNHKLHDINHSIRVITHIITILEHSNRFPLSKLNAVEMFLLLTSSIAHDIGYYIRISNEDLEFIKSFSEHSYNFSEYYNILFKYFENNKMNEKIAQYHKVNHHLRAGYFLRKTELAKKFDIYEYKGAIATIIEGHHLENLYSSKYKSQFLRNDAVRFDYLSSLLRLANLLDFSPERVPNAIDLLKDLTILNHDRQEIYLNYCTSGVSIKGDEYGLVTFMVFYRNYLINNEEHYCNDRVKNLIYDPIRDELTFIRDILIRNGVLITSNAYVMPVSSESDYISVTEINTKLVENIFCEPEFKIMCPAIYLVRKHEDEVTILEKNGRLICLYDEIEHIKDIGNYCLKDSTKLVNCGFCAAYGEATIKSNKFMFECPARSFDKSVYVKIIRENKYLCQNVTTEDYCRHCGLNPDFASLKQTLIR